MVFEWKSGIGVVTDKTLLICMHYAKWGQRNF